jgi:predicted  nucleic acid-binding Zn-ribbon protein
VVANTERELKAAQREIERLQQQINSLLTEKGETDNNYEQLQKTNRALSKQLTAAALAFDAVRGTITNQTAALDNVGLSPNIEASLKTHLYSNR